MERTSPEWAKNILLGPTLDPTNAPGEEQELPAIKVKPWGGDQTGDHPDAVLLALRAKTLVDAMRDPATTVEAPTADLLDLLDVIVNVRRGIAAFEEYVILALRDRQEANEGDGASWQALANVYDVDRSTMSARVAKMRDAMNRGTTAAYTAEADPAHWRRFPIYLTRDPDGSTWSLVTDGSYVAQRITGTERNALHEAGRFLSALYGEYVRWVEQPQRDNGQPMFTAEFVQPSTPDHVIYANGAVVVGSGVIIAYRNPR